MKNIQVHLKSNFFKYFRLTVLAVSLVFIGISSSSAEEISVISNMSFPVDEISLEELKEIYMGNKIYEKDLKIKPINQSDSEKIKKMFLRKVLNTKIENYKGYWMKQVFHEGLNPPISKTSSQSVIDTVISENGTVGYVWHREAVNKQGIKVLLRIKAE